MKRPTAPGSDAPSSGTSRIAPCCGRCGARYEGSAFADLAPVRTLASDELAVHVVRWPTDVVVDVRACARCQAPIARLRQAS